MTKCAVLMCKNYSNRTTDVSFHPFPTDPARKRKWVKAVRRHQTWIPTKHHRICSLHFAINCFNENSHKQRKLHKDAIPTLHLPVFATNDNEDAMDVETHDSSKTEVSTEPKIATDEHEDAMEIETQDSLKTEVSQNDANVHQTKKQPDPHNSKNIETPRKRRLNRKVQEQHKKIKKLQYENRQLKKKIATMQEILDTLTDKNLLLEENKIILEKVGGKTKDLLKRMKKTIDTGKVSREKYSPELRTFALTLHFYSPRAYKYVRKTFDTCLPAPRTIQKWYSTINGTPGFTSEALRAIKERVGGKAVYGALIIDEMRIMEGEEFHPNSGKTYGFKDYGPYIQSDCDKHAKEVLVFMLVALNASFKVPIGYFATAGLNAEQKSTLILTAVSLLQESGVEVKSLTFDAPRVNEATARKLGCNLDPNNLKTFFPNPVNGNKIYLFFDPCHMLKNVRNAFKAYKIFEDAEGRQIVWSYLEELHNLQENELFYLANKLKANHIHFQTKIMNVRLASQLFSESVANALRFCETELQITRFRGVQATVDFLKIINDLFDVLDSRTHQYGNKRAMNMENHTEAFELLDRARVYLSTLKYNGDSIMKSLRYAGFMGFCVCAESAKGLFNDLIVPENAPMKYLQLHKISQDHLEIFFANVRSHGGHNDNPTVRVFEAIYKKMLVHMELIDVDSGNCTPLESIPILNCSSSSPKDKINMTTPRQNSDRDNTEVSNLTCDGDEENSFDEEHVASLSSVGEKVVEYIAGFVAHKLLKKIKCDICISALLSHSSPDSSSLISYKDKGRLIYPSCDTTSICRSCEMELRKGIENNKLKKDYSTEMLIPRVTTNVSKLNIFENFKFHSQENEEVDHIEQLVIAVAEIYLNTRLAYIRKQAVKKDSKKHIFKKLVHNRSQ